jgi:hypothetical protein
MGGRIGERFDDLELLDHGARPSVGDEQRQRVRLAGPAVDEVDVDAVDVRHELRQGRAASRGDHESDIPWPIPMAAPIMAPRPLR